MKKKKTEKKFHERKNYRKNSEKGEKTVLKKFTENVGKEKKKITKISMNFHKK